MKPMLIISLVLATISIVHSQNDKNKKLIFSQIIWRHGDRSPTGTFKTDIHQEDAWTFGGGGWGQLSPIGMKQHFNLGKKLNARYIQSNYLSGTYNAKEIYVRSTDVNRTIISAMSNMLGMYNKAPNKVNVDYPDIPDWPNGYVPIAIHTVDDDTDYILNADADCRRQNTLWAMAKQSDEIKNFTAQPLTQEVLTTLTKNCGENITIDNLWITADALLIEQIHYPNALNPWVTPELYNKTKTVNDKIEQYQNGIYDNPIKMNNLDIGLELQKIRGGSAVNDVLMHINLKADCRGKTGGKCKWINNLKYYVYSAHDTTLYAFFSCFGIATNVVQPSGYPHYSAALLVELYEDVNTKELSFGMLYHADESLDFTSITNYTKGCTDHYCDLKYFKEVADRVKPDKPMPQWCDVDPEHSSAVSFFTASILAVVAFMNFWM